MVRDLPVALLKNFEGDGFLPFDAQAIHRIRQIDVLMLGHFLDGGHTAIEVGIQRKNQSTVRERLNELRRRSGRRLLTAIVPITHDRAVAGRAKRVVRLRDGRVLDGEGVGPQPAEMAAR